MRLLTLSLLTLGVAAAQTPLEETRWRLVELEGKPAASPPGARQIYLRLAAQRVEGFAGCNTVSGAYTRDGETLKFSGLASTRMACPALDIESSFHRAIGHTVRFSLEAGRLTLLGAEGAKLARFEPDDPWQKVIAVAPGSEIRVVKKSALAKPIAGVLDEATAERLVMVVKNEQIAIAREEIQLVEARPKGGSRVTRTSQSTQNMPMDRPTAANPNERMRPVPPNSTSSTSSGLSIGSKPGYELIYRSR